MYLLEISPGGKLAGAAAPIAAHMPALGIAVPEI